MIGIRTVLVVFVAGVLLSGGLTWRYQENKYSRIIAEKKSEQDVALKKQAEKVTTQERINSELIQKLESNSLDAKQRIASLLADNAALVKRNGGLYLAGKCEVKAGTPSAASSSAPAEANVCRLSDEVAEQLLTEAARADDAAEYASVCYEYAEEVNKQRKRMMEEQE